MRKLLLFGLWFIVCSSTLSSSLLYFYYINNIKSGEDLIALQTRKIAFKNQYEFYAAVPQVLGSFTTAVQASDARPELIRQYLNKYDSPILTYADLIVSLADKYGIDYRLVVAIAQCESNICKIIPDGSYNCWGFGNATMRFSSWEHAIEYVTKTLKENYIDLGLDTPEKMMPKYVPPSIAKGGPWARCVNQFMEEIK